MKIKLSSDEMLAQWKLCRGFAPLRNDCEISRSDGVDLDAILRLEMRDWYLQLLSKAPVEMLSLTDISNVIAMVAQPDGTATVKLPENCRRLVSFHLQGWSREAKIITDPNSYEALLQTNQYSRGKSENPVVVLCNNKLHIYSLPSTQMPKIECAMAVMEPIDGSYEMDEAALSLIPKSVNL